jgi:hypothetical protein
MTRSEESESSAHRSIVLIDKRAGGKSSDLKGNTIEALLCSRCVKHASSLPV